jgi:putative transposase
MRRTMCFKLPHDKNLIDTITMYNDACNACLTIGFENKVSNKNELHKLTYNLIRAKYPCLQSSLVCTCRDQASDMLKREKLKVLPVKKKLSSIRYNQRTFSMNKTECVVSISTIKGRKKINLIVPEHYKQYLSWDIKAATLSMDRRGIIRLNINVETVTPPVVPVKSILGIDRGIINTATLSSNQFFNSKHVRNVKGRYQYLRSQLMGKGTRSAKRKLKRISQKESRFVRDVNHCITKKISRMDYDGFAIEALSVKKQKRLGKKFNKKLGSWSHSQFESFLTQKAERLGKTIISIDPRYTSQDCSCCNHRGNRNGSSFQCPHCGLSLNADLNAARNIAHRGKTLLAQATVNTPNVTCNDTVVSSEHSYKPPISIGGS